MKVTLENYTELNLPECDNTCLKGCLFDMGEINSILEKKGQESKKIFIEIQDYHNEYSPERTDPCPDYYGMYTIRYVDNFWESIGGEMTLSELEQALFVLYDFIDEEE